MQVLLSLNPSNISDDMLVRDSVLDGVPSVSCSHTTHLPGCLSTRFFRSCRQHWRR